MDKISENEEGFSAIETILVIIVIVLLGAVGWLVYKNHHKTNTAATVSDNGQSLAKANKPKALPQPPSPYPGWNSYTLAKEKLSFRYPATWVVDNNLTNSSNDGVQFTSKTDSDFQILVGAGQAVAAVGNYDGNCVQQADQVNFDNQTGYLDLVGFANINADPPSCSPASSTIQEVLLSTSSTNAAVTDFFLTKNIPQPQSPGASEIVVQIFYGPSNDSSPINKTISEIENDANYKDAKLLIDSMSY